MKDLGLTYEQAAHGVQSAIAHKIGTGWNGASDKHLRVGVDMSKSDMYGLVELLIAKGVFTGEEYIEHIRLAANTELAMHEEHINAEYGGGVELTFR
jgi:hypothetical protein